MLHPASNWKFRSSSRNILVSIWHIFMGMFFVRTFLACVQFFLRAIFPGYSCFPGYIFCCVRFQTLSVASVCVLLELNDMKQTHFFTYAINIRIRIKFSMAATTRCSVYIHFYNNVLFVPSSSTLGVQHTYLLCLCAECRYAFGIAYVCFRSNERYLNVILHLVTVLLLLSHFPELF